MELNAKTIVECVSRASDVNVTELLLKQKKITQIAPGVFDRYKSLQVLSFWSNNLTDLPERVFDSLINLKTINLCYNKINSLNVHLFKNNKKLEEIQLYNNNISELNGVFNDLPELRVLLFNSNKIKAFDFRSLRSSTKLGVLHFQYNNLREINILDNLKWLYPELYSCAVAGNNFNKSYLKRVINSLESQSIKIENIDKSKGIEPDSVYGLKCIPDDIRLYTRVDELTIKEKHNQKENQKLREELNNTNKKLDEMQKLIQELHNQINDNKTHYEVERPIMLKKFTEMLGHYKSYEKRVDKLRLDTGNKFFREKVKLRKKIAFTNKKNVRLEDLIINCQTRIDHLDDKWCEKVDQLETAYMTERPFILSSLNQLTRDNQSNQKSILKFKTKIHYEKMNKIFTKYEEKFKTFQDEMDDAVDNTNLIYINEKSSLLKRLNDFTSQHDRKQREADDWKVNMQNKIVRLNKKFKERNSKCDSQNTKIKNAMAEDEEKIRLLQKEMRQKVEEADSFYKRDRTGIIGIIKRLEKDSIDLADGQEKADVQLKLIREDGQKEVNRLKTKCKDNFDELSEDIKRCNATFNVENENIQKMIVKNDDDMKKLVGEMGQKINENKNSEEQGKQVIRDKCNKLERGHNNLEEKQRNVDVQLAAIRNDGKKQLKGLRKDFGIEFDKLSTDIKKCNATCNKDSIKIKASIIRNDEYVMRLVGQMGKKINGNKKSAGEERQVICDKCNKLESECKRLERKRLKKRHRYQRQSKRSGRIQSRYKNCSEYNRVDRMHTGCTNYIH